MCAAASPKLQPGLCWAAEHGALSGNRRTGEQTDFILLVVVVVVVVVVVLLVRFKGRDPHAGLPTGTPELEHGILSSIRYKPNN